jgi:hypothetical protein
MNTGIYKTVMRGLLQSNAVADRKVFAEIMAKAYQMSTVGFSGTIFGAKLISGDFAFLTSSINNALDANFADTTRGVNQSAYNLMAIGFMGYWASAKFTPMPYKPAMTVTVKGPVVTVPGSPSPLGGNIFYSFVLGEAEAHLNAICTSLLVFHKTITGTISGNSSNGASVVLPWVGII